MSVLFNNITWKRYDTLGILFFKDGESIGVDELSVEIQQLQARLKEAERVIDYPDSLPSDIHDTRDCFAEWCEVAREYKQKYKNKE